MSLSAKRDPLRESASPLADQARVVAVRLDLAFQQQIHHDLGQVAAGAPSAQRGRVVEGSHVVLRRGKARESFDFWVGEGDR